MSREATEAILDSPFLTKEPEEGLGLGLTVVQRIVAGYRGAMTASVEPGKGSIFQVLLPRMEDQALVESRRIERLATGKERILLVDDEEALVALGQQMLNHLGYGVLATGSSTEALALFQQSPKSFDLIITNQTMPHMTGVQLARKVLSIRPDIPVVLCTGFGDAVPQIKALEIGIKDFLIKPVVMSELASCIRRVLDESRK